ncbi:hypothetical protein B0T10DRAFT_89435 [Thelonectria olida]|uniref:Glycosyl transferase CAP10 domain-containing protein n=1 Tax=Thelonectria olida TaxID=1576542 RepID=A0A9P9AN13_9HYPO|nr:hypothetical protein B0T10DRAFT_89435 [Thelonectria olida]
MASNLVVQLSSLCAALSFFYISQTLERHSLTESPRLSSFLVFLLSGAICYGVSCFTKWLPGADGRFKTPQRSIYNAPLLDGAAKHSPNAANPYLPKRPRRLSLPLLVVCIVLRLEIFHFVNYQQQCSTPGVESFLCIVLFAYEIFTTRRKWGIPPVEDADDPWRTCFDDLFEWFTGPRVVLANCFIGALILTTGTYNVVGQVMPSTYACFSPLEGHRTTLFLQCIGLLLDALIVVLLWRTLAWSRTAKLRLRTLGTILVLPSLCMGLIWLSHWMFTGSKILHTGFGFLYGFDIIVDSLTFASLMISATYWVCETSPLTPSSVITFLVGMAKVVPNIYNYGDYLHSSRGATLIPLYFIGAGVVVFAYCHQVRSILFIRRFIVVAILFGLAVGTTVYVAIEPPQTFQKRHPLSDYMYKANIKHEKWKRHVATSGSLPVAVKIYKERHDGKNPPPGFSAWYDLAKDTVVIDQFDQIEADLHPFSSMSPKNLRKRVTRATQLPGVSTITIQDGKASGSPAAGSESEGDLDLLVAMINQFSKHLPDMIIPINLSPTPRVLPTWEEANGQSHADLTPIVNLISRSTEEVNGTEELLDARNNPNFPGLQTASIISPSKYRQMQVDGCAPGSQTRTSPHWNIGRFCPSCIRRHSKGPLMVHWDRSMNFCDQADVKYLHGMTLSAPRAEPIRDMLPLFGASKTQPFQDIIIPIPKKEADVPDIDWDFRRRYDTLFWRGKLQDGVISDQALRGSPKMRLLNMITKPNLKDQTTMLLPVDDNKADRFRFEKVSLVEANRVIPVTMGISNFTGCVGRNCDLIKQAYGSKEEEGQEPLEYRYVMLVDEDGGPPPEFLRFLKSKSVPFLSTMFRTWYTDRLIPWLHFVPIDVRYHALHTTMSYFAGTEKRGKVNYRHTKIPAHGKDAQWIGSQGASWVHNALSAKDMEVYLFRVLMEWGRLVDDKRDDIGFWADKKGEYHNDAWTRGQEW